MLTCMLFGLNKDASWAVWALLFICTVRVFMLICAELHRYTCCIEKRRPLNPVVFHVKLALVVSVLGFLFVF